MIRTASEKLAIIRLVEESELSARRYRVTPQVPTAHTLAPRCAASLNLLSEIGVSPFITGSESIRITEGALF